MARAPRVNEGRPLKLNAPIGKDAEGNTITVRTAILDWLGKGYPQAVAIGRAGIRAATMNTWLRRGAEVAQRVSLDPHSKLTPDDRDLLVFVAQVDRAVAEAHGRYWEKVKDLADGGLTKSKVIIKTERQMVNGVPQNVEVSRIHQAEQQLPDMAALRYVLEQQYGHRLTDEERAGLTEEDAARHLGDAMERWLQLHDADDPVNANGNGKAAPH